MKFNVYSSYNNKLTPSIEIIIVTFLIHFYMHWYKVDWAIFK